MKLPPFRTIGFIAAIRFINGTRQLPARVGSWKHRCNVTLVTSFPNANCWKVSDENLVSNLHKSSFLPSFIFRFSRFTITLPYHILSPISNLEFFFEESTLLCLTDYSLKEINKLSTKSHPSKSKMTLWREPSTYIYILNVNREINLT